MSTYRLCTAAAATVLLAACGDNPYEPAAPAAPAGVVPTTATASARSYTLFTASLPSTETGAPLTMDEVKAPTSESEEPLPVT